MAGARAVIIENVNRSLEPGLSVYDVEGEKVGTVKNVHRETGYAIVKTLGLTEDRLYIPFRIITAIDPREMYVSLARNDLHREYGNPPPRSTTVADLTGKMVATTTEPSGYDGTPIVVEQVVLDDLKTRIAVGDHVYTSELADLGRIEAYDPSTGWMMIGKGIRAGKHDLMVPVKLVDDVDPAAHKVYLVASRADLTRMQRVEPAYVVFS